MVTRNSKKQAKWWCIHFGQTEMDLVSAKKLQYFFKKITPHVVFGHHKVFLEVSQCKWKKSLYAVQLKLSSVAKNLNLDMELWQWGVGNSIAESWVMARWKTLTPEFLPLEAISDFMNPLGLDKNKVIENHRLKLLHTIGANSLLDILEIPEDVLLSKCGIWIADFNREHFSCHQSLMEDCLEKVTSASFFQEPRAFRLEDWIPEEYLQVA
jgi:hypothetical protein